MRGLGEMKDSEQFAATGNAPQVDEIMASLEQLLTEFDAMELTIPAIKIAEAIDCLKQS